MFLNSSRLYSSAIRNNPATRHVCDAENPKLLCPASRPACHTQHQEYDFLAVGGRGVMADNYPQFLSSVMAGAEAHAPRSQEELNHSFLAGQPLPINTVPLNYQNFGHFTGFPGPSFAFQQSTSKGRRKSASAAAAETEQIKHRRTRSGCFTCRGRRVKVILHLRLGLVKVLTTL